MQRGESNLHGLPVSPLRKASGFQLGGEHHLIIGSGPKPYREPVTIKVATLEEAKKCKVKEQSGWSFFKTLPERCTGICSKMVIVVVLIREKLQRIYSLVTEMLLQLCR